MFLIERRKEFGERNLLGRTLFARLVHNEPIFQALLCFIKIRCAEASASRLSSLGIELGPAPGGTT